MVAVSICAVFHKYAHSPELPKVSSGVIAVRYVVGFLWNISLYVIVTFIDHTLLRNERSAIILRETGV